MSPTVEKLIEQRNQARAMARAAYQFIEEGCFCDEVGFDNPGTPGFDLWVSKWVYREYVEANPWVKEEQLWAEDTTAKS